ncbi:DUF3560 domain-containing protein [Streptomyces sp. BI20]|uniref:DUF3560 domain-containing protein n=1 Tax=Streptomyces sp. BI20 TaxID=3403460 RepID=UPI003C77288C
MTIKITHSPREGTLITGTSRHGEEAEILRARHYPSGYTNPARWTRELECWYLPHTRDQRARGTVLTALAERLTEAGHPTTVTINNDDRRPFAEAEAERIARAADRADRFTGYAENASARSTAAWRAGHAIADGIPYGQPILVGHHSERRARRDQARIEAATRRSIEEHDRAEHWTRRAQAAAGHEAGRADLGTTLRRLEKLRAELRAVEKWQAGRSAKGQSRDTTDPSVREDLHATHQQLTEEIAHWEEAVRAAEAAGAKLWSRADFRPGDLARHRGTWYEVLRVNPRSLTIPNPITGNGSDTVRAADDPRGLTTTITYDRVSGRQPKPAAAGTAPGRFAALAGIELNIKTTRTAGGGAAVLASLTAARDSLIAQLNEGSDRSTWSYGPLQPEDDDECHVCDAPAAICFYYRWGGGGVACLTHVADAQAEVLATETGSTPHEGPVA